MNADKDTGYGKTLAWASFIRVLSKWMLDQQREPCAQPEHSGRAGPPGPKQRVALRASDAIAETVLGGFVIEEISAKDRIMKSGAVPILPRPRHAANGAFCRAERALLKPMLRWSGRGLVRN